VFYFWVKFLTALRDLISHKGIKFNFNFNFKYLYYLAPIRHKRQITIDIIRLQYHIISNLIFIVMKHIIVFVDHFVSNVQFSHWFVYISIRPLVEWNL